MKIKAFAKVNLYLDIVGKRRSGYHELVTLMCPIGLYDTLRLSFETRKINVSCDHPDVPGGPENIAHKAASRFLAASGRPNNGVAIEIKKNIPVGAGLGGGSSDAAAVLSGLNMHFGSPLPSEALLEIAKTIGSDVPFFLYGKPAVAEGIGEIVTPFPGLRPLPIVLVYPRHILSTRAVYKNFNLALTKKEKIHTKNIFKLDWGTNLHRLLFNALEPSAFALSPQIREMKDILLDSGAAGALMSGSGSSVYGIYNESETAEKAFNRLSRQNRWQVFYTRLMA
ncbi:MAG: 4-(cytidine 5'-diphospho)-2-C-methyl-D-erythritol kinase [Desulfosalsimonadaceae bacterium]